MSGNADNPGRGKETGRFFQIAGILTKHKVALGITPEKLRVVLEDLGPTFVKLGQLLSVRMDLLPVDYCQELQKLRSEVKPMPMDEVTRVVEASLGMPLHEAFPTFDPVPLGSASIAQAHAAVLPGGEHVVVKVQREGIYDKMASDIALLRRAVKPLRWVQGGGTIDFDMVLKELWNVTRQEMDFMHEADNAEEFIRLNQEVEDIGCPRPYRELSTRQVLVMEKIDGVRIDDCEALRREGYDVEEICRKLCDHYMKQVLDDGFFHADPHPGNLRVQDGRIIYLDLGMVGRLSAGDQAAFEKALAGVAARDAKTVAEAVIAITRHSKPVDEKALHEDVQNMLDRYLDIKIGQMNLGDIMQESFRIAQRNDLQLPQGITLLGRGVSTLEGVVADISPETNLLQIVAQRFMKNKIKTIDWKQLILQNARHFYESASKSVRIPSLVSDTLQAALQGDLTVRVETAPSDAVRREEKRRASLFNRSIVFTGLFMGSCLVTLTEITPRILGLPWPAVTGFGLTGLYGLLSLWQMRRRRE